MHNYSKERYLFVQSISKISFIILIIVFLMNIITTGLVNSPVFIFFSILFSLYFCVPGLAIFWSQWISQAWLSALNSWLIPEVPWSELAIEIRFLIFISSIFLLLVSFASLYFLFSKFI